MEDAYVIGIRLALDNGVSAGVASIRKDLSALDGAIASTAASLRDLAAISATTMAAAGQPTRTSLPETGPVQPHNTKLPIPPPSPRTQTITEPRAPLPPSATPDPPVPRSQPIPSASPLPATPPTAARTVLTPPIMTSPTVISLRPEPAAPPNVRALPTASTSPANITRETSPVPLAPTAEKARPSTTTLPANQPASKQISAPTSSNLSERRLPDVGPNVSARQAPQAAPSELPRPPETPATSSPVSVAPHRPQPSTALNAVQPSANASASLPSVAPQAPQQSAPPTGGDVFLDGTRLGYWLSNHLSRTASRPPAGATGFDPRLGISWPGSQQGGG